MISLNINKQSMCYAEGNNCFFFSILFGWRKRKWKFITNSVNRRYCCMPMSVFYVFQCEENNAHEVQNLCLDCGNEVVEWKIIQEANVLKLFIFRLYFTSPHPILHVFSAIQTNSEYIKKNPRLIHWRKPKPFLYDNINVNVFFTSRMQTKNVLLTKCHKITYTITVGYVDVVMDSVSEWEITEPGSDSIRVSNFHIRKFMNPSVHSS